ncbi:TIR domain-containing protein [Azospirillum largimobile]
MAFLTESEVLERAERVTKRLRKSVTAALTESVSIDSKFDVFLSHSSNESEKILLGVKDYLEEYSLTVYVDKYNDPDLSPDDVTKETASRLRNRLVNSSTLLYVHSGHSTKSRWMPWELGFMDGKSGKIGVLPVTKSPDRMYSREEYLTLYPYIDKFREEVSQKEYLWVNESSERYARLDLWIKGKDEIRNR